MSQQRQKDLEEILGLWYKKLAFFEKKLPLVDGLQQELVIQEKIKESNSKISQYETEYWDIMTQDAIFVFDNDEQEAEESLQDITVAVQQVEATNLSPEVVEVVKEIRDRLNTPKEPASAKLKATLPLIPSILSYEIELNTSQIIHKVLEKVRKKKLDLSTIRAKLPSQPVHILKNHSELVKSVAISPDGQTLASSSADKTINLWSLKTNELLYSLKAYSSGVMAVRFSPDGQTLATASNLEFGDANIKLWDVKTGQLKGSLGGKFLNLRSSCLAFSPDGEMLAIGNIDATVKIWKLKTRKLDKSLKGHGWDVTSVDFSSDGCYLVSGALDGAIKVWDWRNGELLNTFNRPSPEDLVGSLVAWFDSSVGNIYSVAFSPDGELIASGGADQPIILWETSTGKIIRTLTEHRDSVFSVCFSPQGRLLASGGNDNRVRIWDYKTGELLQTFKHLSPVYSVVFSPDGNTVFSGSADTTVRIWQIQDLSKPINQEIQPTIESLNYRLERQQNPSNMNPMEPIINLSSLERRQLREAILSAYPSYDDLRIFVDDYFRQNLAAIAGGKTLKHVSHDLIIWARSQGRMTELLIALYEDTQNPEIQIFCQPIYRQIQNKLELNSDVNPRLSLDPQLAWNDEITEDELQQFLPRQYSLEADVGQLWRGLAWANSVCRITHNDRPQESATGVLIAPNLVLTNYHVLSLDDSCDLGAIARSLRFEFGYISDPSGVTIQPVAVAEHQPVIHASPVAQLDYVLLQLEMEGVATMQPVQYDSHQRLPPKAPLNLLQHPDGERMKVSLSNNGVVKTDDVRGLVYYVNRTQGGSSGSPCFNEDWRLVALHHKEKQTSFGSLREGILFQSIYAKISQFL